MSASKNHRESGLQSWDTKNMIQANKAVCNKEMGYLAATLYDYIRWSCDPFQATKSKLGRTPIIPPALEEKLVEYILLSVNIWDALETMLED